MKRKRKIAMMSPIAMVFLFGAYLTFTYQDEVREFFFPRDTIKVSYEASKVPKYQGQNHVIVNENKPNFKEEDYTEISFERYQALDDLSRCGVAFANVGTDLMPKEERGSIGQIKPSGWHLVKYDNVSGKYLYNRCHLIGYQLTGEGANEKNLITYTRQMNTDGMLEFENRVADYVKRTNHHVLYRVTPVFEGENLIASGVFIEASSVEDRCGEICFHVFVYNVQDGIEIDYKTGDSKQIIKGTSEK